MPIQALLFTVESNSSEITILVGLHKLKPLKKVSILFFAIVARHILPLHNWIIKTCLKNLHELFILFTIDIFSNIAY